MDASQQINEGSRMNENHDDSVINENIFSTPQISVVGPGNKRKKGDMTPSPITKSADNKKVRTEEDSDSQSLELILSLESQCNETDKLIENLQNIGANVENKDETSNNSEGTISEASSDSEGSDHSEYICNICEEKAEENTVECEGCKKWLHAGCVNLSSTDLKAIDKLDGKLKWFCRECAVKVTAVFLEDKREEKTVTYSQIQRSSEIHYENNDGDNVDDAEPSINQAFNLHEQKINRVIQELDKNLNENLSLFKRDLKELEDYVDQLSNANINEKISRLENQLSELRGQLDIERYENRTAYSRFNVIQTENNYANTRKNISNQRLNTSDSQKSPNGGLSNTINENQRNHTRNSEQENRNIDNLDRQIKRAKNLIIYNMYESTSEDVYERVKEDTNNVHDMLYYLQFSNYKILKVARLGQRKDGIKPRPLLVKFEKEQEKWIALSQGKYLGQSEKFYNIFLAKDMSKEEMEEDRKNRHRVIDGRKKGENLMIKNGNVIMKRKGRHLH